VSSGLVSDAPVGFVVFLFSSTSTADTFRRVAGNQRFRNYLHGCQQQIRPQRDVPLEDVSELQMSEHSTALSEWPIVPTRPPTTGDDLMAAMRRIALADSKLFSDRNLQVTGRRFHTCELTATDFG